MTDQIIVEIERELEDLIPWYLENRINHIKTIREALEKADYKTVCLLGHSMKGSGGGYGFEQITWIGISSGSRESYSWPASIFSRSVMVFS